MTEDFSSKGLKVKGQGRGMICAAFGLYFFNSTTENAEDRAKKEEAKPNAKISESWK